MRRPFLVTGFGRDGKQVFAITVDALDTTDAGLLAGAEMRKTPQGTALWTRAVELTARPVEAPSRGGSR